MYKSVIFILWVFFIFLYKNTFAYVTEPNIRCEVILLTPVQMDSSIENPHVSA